MRRSSSSPGLSPSSYVQRLEMVVRGRGIRVTASRGEAMAALQIGAERLPRWEARALDAHTPIVFTLAGLPVTRGWLPPAVAGGFALLLAGGFAAALKTRPPAGVAKVEESPPVRRN